MGNSASTSDNMIGEDQRQQLAQPKQASLTQPELANLSQQEQLNLSQQTQSNLSQPKPANSSQPKKGNFSQAKEPRFSQPKQANNLQLKQGNYTRPKQANWSQPKQTNYPQPNQANYPQPKQANWSQPEQVNYPQPKHANWSQPKQANYPQPKQANWSQPEQVNYPQPKQANWSQPKQTNYPQPKQANWSQPNQTNYPQPNQANWSQPNQTNYPQPKQANWSQPNQTNYPQPNQANYPQPKQANWSQPNQTNYPQPNQANWSQPNQTNYPQPNQANYPQPKQANWSQPEQVNYPQPKQANWSQPKQANYPQPKQANWSQPKQANYPQPKPANCSQPEQVNYPQPKQANWSQPEQVDYPQPKQANWSQPEQVNYPQPKQANWSQPEQVNYPQSKQAKSKPRNFSQPKQKNSSQPQQDNLSQLKEDHWPQPIKENSSQPKQENLCQLRQENLPQPRLQNAHKKSKGKLNKNFQRNNANDVTSFTAVNSQITNQCENLNRVSKTSTSMTQHPERDSAMQNDTNTAAITHAKNILEIQLLFLHHISPLYLLDNFTLRYNLVPSNKYEEKKGSCSKYETNALRHQLLSPSVEESTKSESKLKQKQRKNKTMKYHFEQYWPLKAVEEGLKNDTLFEGIVRIYQNKYYCFVSNPNADKPDLLVDSIKNRNRAMEGDLVVATILDEAESEGGENENNKEDIPDIADDLNSTGLSDDIDESKSREKNKKKRGKIIFIKERNHPGTCVGHLKLMKDRSRETALFYPRDIRVPRMKILNTSWPAGFYNMEKEYENTLFCAKLTVWEGTNSAYGTILYRIGEENDLQVETNIILKEYQFALFPLVPEYKEFYPGLDYVFPEEEISKRKDCRNMCIFTIDPPTTKDLDDAVSCNKLKNGNFEVGVHIADVSYFLKEQTPLDKIVEKRAMTVNMVGNAYPMLPEELCLLCSLLPGVDRLAFSVFWEITSSGQILYEYFSRTIINSACQLSYNHAQAVIDGCDLSSVEWPEMHGNWTFDNCKDSILTLAKLARIFRSERLERGALTLNQAKSYFNLDVTNGLPISCGIYEIKESHKLIEDFMLLANVAAAKRIYNDFPQLALLRNHSPPEKNSVMQMDKQLTALGLKLDFTSAGTLQKSLKQLSESHSWNVVMVLKLLCAMKMKQPLYFCANCETDTEKFKHFALNMPIYTHFTSPIQRYADIVVHRYNDGK